MHKHSTVAAPPVRPAESARIVFLSFLAFLVPCARSLDPFPHPSIPPQCKATDWAVMLRGKGTHRERDRRGCGLNLAAWIYRDSPSGFLFVSGTAPWSHSTEFGCYYEAGGLREAGFWTDPSPSPRATEPTHTRPRPACKPASLRVGTSSWPRQWGCGEARAHLFEARIPKMPTKLLTEQALVPLRWPSAGVYSQQIYCGVHSMYLEHSQASEQTRCCYCCCCCSTPVRPPLTC